VVCFLSTILSSVFVFPERLASEVLFHNLALDSSVLYVNPPYWTNHASNYVKKYPENSRAYTDNERETMYTAIERKLKSLEPDELDRTEYYGVRAWWD
jgi:hypothetical protein